MRGDIPVDSGEDRDPSMLPGEFITKLASIPPPVADPPEPGASGEVVCGERRAVGAVVL